MSTEERRPTTEAIFIVRNETNGVTCQAFAGAHASEAALHALEKLRAVAPDRRFSMTTAVLIRS